MRIAKGILCQMGLMDLSNTAVGWENQDFSSLSSENYLVFFNSF